MHEKVFHHRHDDHGSPGTDQDRRSRTEEAAPEWSYTLNGPQVNYTEGQRVTRNGRLFECRQWDAASMAVIVPPEANPEWWAEVQGQ